MGSNLQRVLGLMTPDKVNAMVDQAAVNKKEIIKEINTSIDPDTKEDTSRNQYQANSQKQEDSESPNEKPYHEVKSTITDICANNKNSSAKNKSNSVNRRKTPGENFDDNVLFFDNEHIKKLENKSKQKTAINNYKKNVVPNYLKGTSRKDLQGLLINKKCG